MEGWRSRPCHTEGRRYSLPRRVPAIQQQQGIQALSPDMPKWGNNPKWSKDKPNNNNAVVKQKPNGKPKWGKSLLRHTNINKL